MAEDLNVELQSLKAEVAELREMVMTLMAPKKVTAPTPAPAAAPAPKKAEAVSEETMFIISAAIAAFLGKRATIKFVRPIQTAVDGWRLQGRVSIHGSHRIR